MGLDITAYRQIKRTGDVPEDGDYNYDALAGLHPEGQYLPERADGIANGLYTFTEKHGFRAGSYSGYSEWRGALAMAVHGDAIETIWAALKSGTGGYEGKAFVELLNFSDCEGVIGPKTSAKLAADFKAHREAVLAKEPKGWGEGWWRECYDNWTKAFEMAADGGCVEFH